MKSYRLADEYVHPEVERRILAALSKDPALYWELLDTLPPDAFAAEKEAWEIVSSAIENESTAEVPGDWPASLKPQEDAQLLADAFQRRLLADVQERLGERLLDTKTPASSLATLLEEEAAGVQAAIRETSAGQMIWATGLVSDVLEEASERARLLKETGNPLSGLTTSLPRLDAITGGLQEGLTLLAGPPGVGKTTFALQLAGAVAPSAPVIYASFENGPRNLVLKAICSTAGVNPFDVQRGTADLAKLHRGADAWEPIAERMVIMEGSAGLTVAQLRAMALRAMNRHKSERCLIIVDYLQLMAKGTQAYRGFSTVREKVESLGAELRSLSARLGSPVLALASQNRSEGNYDGAKGSANLASLKESGDLEYGADVIFFLIPDKDRATVAPARAVKLNVGKNRHGATGEVPLIFRPDIGTLREEGS